MLRLKYHIHLIDAAFFKSTLACGIHGRLKTTTGKAIILTNNQDKKYNTKEHLKVNNCYSRRRVLRVDTGTQREYSSKPLKHSIDKRILLFQR